MSRRSPPIARCPSAKTTIQVVFFRKHTLAPSLFDSHLLYKKQTTHPNGYVVYLEQVMGIEPT